MAEFKLGRIRFIWKGDWTSSNQYYVDDVVRHGGNTYVATTGHTSSSSFSSDQSNWSKLSEGQSWKEDWQTSTLYKVNDIVKYGGYLYIANTEHTSSETIEQGLEQDQENWDLFAEGFDWNSFWEESKRYKINDIVKYGGILYLCINEHTSSSTADPETGGLEANLSDWEIFSKGFNWKGEWQASEIYNRNDIVKYGGIIYVANTGHTSADNFELGLEEDIDLWDLLHEGFDYKGDWTQNFRYKRNDVVSSGASLWIATDYHTSQNLLEDNSDKWEIFVAGLEFEDSWSPFKNYDVGDVVTYGGYSYVAKTNHIESKPNAVDSSDWDLFNTGFRFAGDWGDDSSAEEYKIGDVVRLNGFTYLCIKDTTGQKPPESEYWELLNSGFEWQSVWENIKTYVKGDTVRYDESSYVCVQEHISDNLTNRPDIDTNGDFWNLVAGGEELNVLSQEGDLVYYGGAGPTRLPIGLPGQVLTVNSTADAPFWSFFGSTNNIFIVNYSSGLNEPAPSQGVSSDSPWKNVYYGTYQIEEGALRANATYLIKTNRAFIENEAIAWANDQIASETAPFASDFTYSESTWQEILIQILDAIIYDLSHGGNIESRTLANNIYNQYNLSSQSAEFSATLDYIRNELLPDIINSLPVDTTFTSFSQNIVQGRSPEDDALPTAQNLTQIFSLVISTQDTNNLPREAIANNTVFVKSGTLQEILPMSVPSNTAVVGDELRSTRIEPKLSIEDSTADAQYMLGGVERLKNIIDSIVLGNDDITESTGNNEQFVDPGLVVGDASSSADAVNLLQQIYDYIDYDINGVTADSTSPVITGSNSALNNPAYTYAAEAIEKNRNYLIQEAISFIEVEYPSGEFDKVFYREMFDRYINSVQYDLRYTGNYKSLTAAKVYTNSILGNESENMFFLRNGTGLRNCTVAGLSGVLSSPNSFGTKRPSAGAFVSLDPGWGPDDERVWISKRSPYVQNVTTFGDQCIGCKIDGSLHNGGNDSIVANDFTQLVSGGIGIWCTNLGRTELVSVFSYYAHIGYLSENGGKIRATNGNSSYGDFGTVAEGVDATETPITGTVDNRFGDAIVQNVLTDGDKILTFEYLNAGQNYTPSETSFTVLGEGFGASIDQVQTVDDAVFEVRLLNPSDNFGGDGFLRTQNTGQSGDTNTITISATDVRPNEAYETMAIYLISGQGAGQYGVVADYNSQTKIVQVGDPAVGLVAASATDGSTNEVTLETTEELSTGDIVRFTGTEFGGISLLTDYVIEVIDSTTVTLSEDGSPVSLSTDTGSMNLYKRGWAHVAGLAIKSSLDETTEYSIEPRLVFSKPNGGLYSQTAKARVSVEDDQIIEIRIWDPGQGYTSAPSLSFVDPNKTDNPPVEVRVGSGVLTQPTWTDRGNAFTTADATVTGDGFADIYQPGSFVVVKNLTDIPESGSNVIFDSLPTTVFKLVTTRSVSGTGPFSAELQISPELTISQAPEHNEPLELRIRYSQVRLTGHDFLDIGTGNFSETNYPNEPEYEPDPDAETLESNGGRVFYTSTDQDGNFRVGDLFEVEQSTGVASLNADAFNLSGLQELQLGALQLGGTTAAITEFSTDGTFTANSDQIVPTQKAIRTYIQSQIGGGQGEINVNSVTAGDIRIIGNQILNTSGNLINITSGIKFNGTIGGAPAALNYFISQ